MMEFNLKKKYFFPAELNDDAKGVGAVNAWG